MNLNESKSREIAIRDYLLNRLPQSEKSTFEQLLQSDTNFRKEVEDRKVLKEALRREKLRMVIENNHHELIRKSKGQPKSVWLVPKTVIRAAAVVSFAVLTGGVGYIASLGGSSVASFQPETLYATRSGHAISSEIEALYKQKEYAQGLRYLSALNSVDRKQLSAKDWVLLGNAAWQEGQQETAKSYFENALTIAPPDTDWEQSANYYLGLWHLENGAFEQTRDLWKPIVRDTDHRYHNKVADRWTDLQILLFRQSLFGA